jgi:hypothetical protein
MNHMNSKWLQRLGLVRIAILGVGGVVLLVLALIRIH